MAQSLFLLWRHGVLIEHLSHVVRVRKRVDRILYERLSTITRFLWRENVFWLERNYLRSLGWISATQLRYKKIYCWTRFAYKNLLIVTRIVCAGNDNFFVPFLPMQTAVRTLLEISQLSQGNWKFIQVLHHKVLMKFWNCVFCIIFFLNFSSSDSQ